MTGTESWNIIYLKDRNIHKALLAVSLIFLLSIQSISAYSAGNKAGFKVSKDTKPALFYVEKVVDGDTIILSDGRIIRYLGIDTTELRKKERGVWVNVSEPYSQEAFLLNAKLLKNRQVRLEYDLDKNDQYQRDLCYVFADNIFVNEVLLKEGLAFPYLKSKNLRYYERLKNAFLEAVSNKKNLYRINLKYEKNPDRFLGQYIFFEGRVKNIIAGNNQTEIFFDRFIVQIPKTEKNIKIDDYLYVFGRLKKKKDRFVIYTEKNKLFRLP